MKKLIVLGMLLLSLMLLVSCVDYKAAGDNDVVDSEIANVDTDMGAESEELDVEVESEVSEPVQTEEESSVVVEETQLEGLSELVTIEVAESDFVDLGAVVVDPDNDVVEYYFSSPTNREGQWQTSYGDAGEYVITLTASDSVHTVMQDILLRVLRVNVAPEIVAISDMYYKEGDEIVFSPEVSDPNNDAVDVTVSGPLASGLFETDHTSAGQYEIRVVASDGELSTEEVFMLTIDDVNVLPVLSGVSDIVAQEGDVVELDVLVEDLDGDIIDLTISEPIGNDGVWETSFTDNGEYVVTVSANDGKDVVTETISVVIEDVNMPPQIIDVNLERN